MCSRPNYVPFGGVDSGLDLGRGRIANIYVEQLRCTVKYEKVHLGTYRDAGRCAGASLVLREVLKCSWSSPSTDPKRRASSAPHSIVSRMPVLA